MRYDLPDRQLPNYTKRRPYTWPEPGYDDDAGYTVIPRGRGRPPRRHAWLGLVTAALLIVAAISGVAYTRVRWSHAAAPVTAGAQAASTAMLFGTNMSLFDGHDQIVNNPATQTLLRQKQIPLIRMPFRSSLSDATELQGLQAIKNIGAAPLVIIRGAVDPNVATDDAHEINLVQSVFGSSTVYIEYGNEEDLAGVNVTRYTNSWNAVVPSLKALAPTYKFIGPVNFQDNPTYIATFDQNANPRPDFNSWHEYTCNTSNPDQYCLDHISHWTTHIVNTNNAVRAAIGTTIPIMITEWNLDPNQDPRYANASYIQNWTATALQTLAANAANGVVAATQYCATNNQGFNLIDSGNSPTPQGQTLFQLRAGAGSGTSLPVVHPPIATLPASQPTATTTGSQPVPPVSPQPTVTSEGPQPAAGSTPATPAVPAAPAPPRGHGRGDNQSVPVTLAFSYEDGGTDGWSAHGTGLAVANSTVRAMDGSHSLQVSLTEVTATGAPFVTASTQAPATPGQALSFYIYVPQGTGTVFVRPFTRDQTQRLVGARNFIPLVPGWNHVMHALPGALVGQTIQIGVQFAAAPGTTVSGNVYIDTVGWD